ncbi:MAG: helix-turn-helix domain-containing protein [Candidatus Saccharibacteria bacterium]
MKYNNDYTNEGSTMLDPRALLAQLDLTESEIDVYLALLKGAQSARDIVVATGRSRPTVYYALGSLERRGLLSKTGLEDDNLYRVESLKRLQTMARQKQAAFESLQDDVGAFVRQFQTRTPADRKPGVAFYEGISAVQNVIMETVYCQARQIDTIVPNRSFFWQLGLEFVEKYVDLRHTLGVKTRNLWSEPVEQDIIDQFYDKVEIRVMPGGLGDRFRSTVFIYDDSVLYISSLASGYALLVRSVEHRELMRELYGVVWGLSKPLQ